MTQPASANWNWNVPTYSYEAYNQVPMSTPVVSSPVGWNAFNAADYVSTRQASNWSANAPTMASIADKFRFRESKPTGLGWNFF